MFLERYVNFPDFILNSGYDFINEDIKGILDLGIKVFSNSYRIDILTIVSYVSNNDYF